MRTGTNHFESFTKAIKYYQPRCRDLDEVLALVKEKIDSKAIEIGPPKHKAYY